MKNRIIKNILLITVVLAGLIVFQKNGNATSIITQNEQQEKSVEIAKDQVCMVNDAFMGAPQIEIPVEDKIYYGCCKMCVNKLNNYEEIRTAVDPFSKEKVDKADAYIVLDPNSDQNGVFYFKSANNYKKYMESQK